MFFPSLWRLARFEYICCVQFASAHVEEMRTQLKAGKIEDSKKWMVLRLLQYKYDSLTVMPYADIISERVGHMFVSIFAE